MFILIKKKKVTLAVHPNIQINDSDQYKKYSHTLKFQKCLSLSSLPLSDQIPKPLLVGEASFTDAPKFTNKFQFS